MRHLHDDDDDDDDGERILRDGEKGVPPVRCFAMCAYNADISRGTLRGKSNRRGLNLRG
jgi:hypothetical protein